MQIRTNPAVPLLLDTHVWLWMVGGSLDREEPAICRQIRTHLEQNTVYVSAISMWEIAMLEAKKHIELPTDCIIWLKRALSAPGIELEDFSPEIAVASTRLPGEPPRDLSDRIIIASAMSLGAVLATRDREIISYCEKHELPCLAF